MTELEGGESGGTQGIVPSSDDERSGDKQSLSVSGVRNMRRSFSAGSKKVLFLQDLGGACVRGYTNLLVNHDRVFCGGCFCFMLLVALLVSSLLWAARRHQPFYQASPATNVSVMRGYSCFAVGWRDRGR